jgi:glycosyltransferase involved in cell wall biosynthesis
MQQNVSISVVLPAFNEEENIEETVRQAISYLEKNVKEFEIIVVNDGSIDRTGEIVKEIATANNKVCFFNHPKNQGYGAALRSGFEKASLDYIFLMDSDAQFDISELDRFLPFLEESMTIIGYREKRADSFVRILNTWLYHLYIRSIFGLKVKDIDCAFKVFPRMAYEKIRPLRADGALFSAEFLLKLIRNGYRIKELPVTHHPRLFGKQTGANLGVILRMFKECWKLRNDIRDPENWNLRK